MANSSVLYLVGAGPGDPELITLKAVKVLERADVVLYDALVNKELLTYAPKNAIVQYVGKRTGVPSTEQSEINQLIVEYGREYTSVVRLKGGDPFVFGRAMEEIEIAVSAGMQVEIIPGISSALGVPAINGIPLTARGTADSFWVITGSTMNESVSNDIYLAAKSNATVVILMGITKLDQIVAIFKEHRSATTPVALIENGSLPNQRMLVGTLSNIVEDNKLLQIGSPAIIVIGDCVNRRNLSEFPSALSLQL